LRWIRGRNSSTHSLAAGLAAGVRIGFYPNTSLFLYITWKTIETLYHQGVDVGLMPRIPRLKKFYLFCNETGGVWDWWRLWI